MKLCECGNTIPEDEAYCEWCIPHEHEEVSNPHRFSYSGICSDCRLMAQDCCEASTECSGEKTKMA